MDSTMVARNPDNPNRPQRPQTPAPTAPVRVCPQCQHPTRKLYRIKCEQQGPWILACAICQARLSEENPHYVYGGVLSGTPRRRRQRPIAAPKPTP
jgi:hypothetical protein